MAEGVDWYFIRKEINWLTNSLATSTFIARINKVSCWLVGC